MPAYQPISVIVQKVEGELRYDRELFDAAMAIAPDGCYELIFKRTKKDKSYRQVKMIFGLMIEEAVRQAKDKTIGVEDLMIYLLARDIPKGQEITKDYLHQLMYIICPTTDENGERVTLSQMNTIQASSLFERFRNILAPLRIVIPDPNPKWSVRQSHGKD